ncbi:MAG: hypothetical protein ABJE66_11050 [Deltaproteobacteria bacterium]
MWSLPRRIAFRFAFVFAALLLIPFPFGTVPHTDAVNNLVIDAWGGVLGAVERMLGLSASVINGDSSDTLAGWLQVGIAIVVATIGAAVWSALDRRRTEYPRLAWALEIYVRYWLATSMITYGLVKLLPIQFPAPHLATLDEHVGEMSPMGLMWTFMGYSRAYQCFAGGAELLGGVLLLWRRTRAIGAFVLAAVLLNVVILNFCYDVPVKLGSLELWGASVALLAPALVRMVRAMLGHAVPEVPPRVRGTLRWERARIGGGLAAVVLIAWSQWALLGDTAGWFSPPTPLDGSWLVERQTDAGVDRPPLATDAERWARIQVLGGQKGGGQVGIVVVAMTGERRLYRAQVDAAAASVLMVARGDLADPAVKTPPPQSWHYTIVDPDHVQMETGTTQVVLRRAPPGLLVTRSFHWVQDWAFIR